MTPQGGTIDHRDELLFLLGEAAELEHGLACSYLFAGFSIKAAADRVPGPAVAALDGWKRTIAGIAVEEMGHLALVNNLLVSLGGAPHFQRPNFPQPCGYYLPDYHLGLMPFSEQTLQHFIFVERPGDAPIAPAVQPAANQPVAAPAENAIGPDPASFQTVADLYQAIEGGFTKLVELHGERGVFVAGPAIQADPAITGMQKVTPVTDLATARAALDTLVSEGEGDRGNRADSHFGRFTRIRHELAQVKAAHPGFEPARPVLHDPFPRTPPNATAQVNVLSDPATVAVSDLFDGAYTTMLRLLTRAFGAGAPAAERKTLMDAATSVMSRGVAPLAELLTRLPAGPTYPGRTAGPSFGVHGDLGLSADQPVAWRLLIERLQELAGAAGTIRLPGDYGRELTAVAGSLREVAGELTA